MGPVARRSGWHRRARGRNTNANVAAAGRLGAAGATGAPGLLEPVGDDHLQVTPAPPDPPPGELEKLPRPQRTAPAGDGEPAAPSASVEPAPPRASHLEMPAPPQSRAKRATAGDSGGSRPLAAEGSAAPAAETPVVGDDHLSQGGIPEQRSVQVTERVVVHDHPPPEIAVRAPVSVEPPPADPTLAKSAKKADPLIPAPAIPIRLSAPISTDPTPKRIHQPDLRAELPGRPAEPQTTARLCGGRASLRFASLA